MIRTDHNIVFSPYIAADEAQTLDGIFRNNESAVEGRSKHRLTMPITGTYMIRFVTQLP